MVLSTRMRSYQTANFRQRNELSDSYLLTPEIKWRLNVFLMVAYCIAGLLLAIFVVLCLILRTFQRILQEGGTITISKKGSRVSYGRQDVKQR